MIKGTPFWRSCFMQNGEFNLCGIEMYGPLTRANDAPVGPIMMDSHRFFHCVGSTSYHATQFHSAFFFDRQFFQLNYLQASLNDKLSRRQLHERPIRFHPVSTHAFPFRYFCFVWRFLTSGSSILLASPNSILRVPRCMILIAAILQN